MGLLFAGTEPRDFVLGTYVTSTSTSYRNTTNTRVAVGVGLQSEIQTLPFSGVTTLWWSALVLPTRNSSYSLGFDGNTVFFRDGTEDVVAIGGVKYDNDNFFVTISTFDGSTWTKQATGSIAYGRAVLARMTVAVVMSDTGSVEVRIGDQVAVSWSGDTNQNASASSITVVGMKHWDRSAETDEGYYTEVMVADYDLRGRQVVMVPPTGNSATNAAFTGVYTDVDENDRDDADTITSTSAGDKEGYTHGGLPAGNAQVEAIVVSARSAKGSSGPATLKAHIRTNSIDYNQAMANPLTAFYQPNQAILMTNPDTSAKFTRAEVDALEFGVESAA